MKFRNFDDPDFDANEVMANYDLKFSYDELLEISKPISNEEFKQYNKWNKFSVSNVNNIEQIFYDIANSKDARKIYKKVNLISISTCIFKFLLIIFYLFLFLSWTRSFVAFFIFETKIWNYLLFGFPLGYCIVVIFTHNIFENYIPISYKNKIDFSYYRNMTSFTRLESAGPLIAPKIYRQKQKIKSKYKIYEALNGENYLVDLDAIGRYYSMRNWYLISKYIVLKKLNINDLDVHYKDDLFIYLNNNNFKESKLKLKSIFNVKFSLSFVELIYWLMSLVIASFNTILSIIGIISWFVYYFI